MGDDSRVVASADQGLLPAAGMEAAGRGVLQMRLMLSIAAAVRLTLWWAAISFLCAVSSIAALLVVTLATVPSLWRVTALGIEPLRLAESCLTERRVSAYGTTSLCTGGGGT